ncbi:hypothetical protein BN59_02432 [Legionella massiliensis]|uniref:Uncharacterized protein n=1 Tax=Legionella massiliensis TaxID=1034943 RepID=A0A078KUJ5_9GAMM|nr:hypothetical protein [Legionella massiliensis]CDZ78125.1 hypothetical protein BN59_02432 [Legionella massiliensis]CEE13863.1 hypothetical protein BN1094_02432 [Legionella massiliensis]
MNPNQWEIIILKPTRGFLSFLAAQLPEVDLPPLPLLQMDNTAYVMAKQDSDEATLNELERHFATMFRHEISRWLGEHAMNKIEGTFLDFLCCFKFEMHSQIVLMEPSLTPGQHLLRVKPRSVLLKWLKSAFSEQPEMSTVLERINLSHLAENATVLVKSFSSLADVKSFVKNYYQCIFETEMLRMHERADEWPNIDSYQTFSRYFAIDIHTQLVHLH